MYHDGYLMYSRPCLVRYKFRSGRGGADTKVIFGNGLNGLVVYTLNDMTEKGSKPHVEFRNAIYIPINPTSTPCYQSSSFFVVENFLFNNCRWLSTLSCNVSL